MLDALREKDSQTSALDMRGITQQLSPDLFEPSPRYYFLDFTLSVIIGNTALYLAALQNFLSWEQVSLIVLSSLTLYRATVFIHELVHQPKKLRWMAWYYNLIHGFVHKLPMYTYRPHLEHHQVDIYGQAHDFEYEDFSNKPLFATLVFIPLVIPLFLPLLILVRGIIVPLLLPFIGSTGREAIYRRINIFAINLRYRRPAPSPQERKIWYIEDAGCVLYAAITGLLIAKNILPLAILPAWYAMIYIALVLNILRGNTVHRYYSKFSVMNRKQMILDSVTMPRSLITMLLFPLGTRFHALHHLLPQLPYHSLETAHEQLMNYLPPDHPYRVTVVKNYWDAALSMSRGTM